MLISFSAAVAGLFDAWLLLLLLFTLLRHAAAMPYACRCDSCCYMPFRSTRHDALFFPAIFFFALVLLLFVHPPVFAFLPVASRRRLRTSMI